MVTMVNTKELWIVWTNTDLTEGRGREYAAAYCELEATAIRLSKGRYVHGTNCRITKETAYVGDDFKIYAPGPLITTPTTEDKKAEEFLIKNRLKAEQKEKALERAKKLGLTEEEIEALR
jgi:hypothetical protein